MTTLHNLREQAPPIGTAPHRQQLQQPVAISIPRPEGTQVFQPITIVGILTDEVSEPRNDGSRGSGLYSIPFKLNRIPLPGWAKLFVHTWDNPPEYTSGHRPGIAQVYGDRLLLTRTTIEEVQRTHRKTLKVVIDKVNNEIAQFVGKRVAAEQSKAEQDHQHRTNVRRIAEDLKFD